jgi:hypothetical protein
MPYDEAFYAQYAAYLREPAVRAAHDFMFKVSDLVPDLHSVVDFGCGQHREYNEHAWPIQYLGVDLNAVKDWRDEDGLWETRIEDYRTMDLTSLPTWATGFVSLFSSEITAPYYHNYPFYNRVFRTCPNIKAGLVSGFFYDGRRKEQPIKEAGDVVSWQTLEHPCVARCVGYTEKRFTLPVPSQMFGPNVYEVWKLFERWA